MKRPLLGSNIVVNAAADAAVDGTRKISARLYWKDDFPDIVGEFQAT